MTNKTMKRFGMRADCILNASAAAIAALGPKKAISGFPNPKLNFLREKWV
jgi:hypothetical protein